jgi:hypothetical protein
MFDFAPQKLWKLHSSDLRSHAATLGCAGAQWNDLIPGEGEAGGDAVAGELLSSHRRP